jgi:hypothetical protein
MTRLMTDRTRSNATLRLGSVAAVEAAKKLQPEKESPAEAGQGYILGSSDEAARTNTQIAAVLRSTWVMLLPRPERTARKACGPGNA